MPTLRNSVIASQVLIALASAGPILPRQNDSMIYDFSKLTASPNLAWVPCYDKFTCTLLEVPLDYTNETAGTANIAFIKKSSSDPNAQDVLINPGGPSGSGVDFVLSAHDLISAKLGPQFNIVGFDPRGVNNSGPSIECFPGADTPNNVFDVEVYNAVDNSTSYSLHRSYERAKMFGKWCSPVLAVNGTAKYANTVAVAQDMLHYVELDAEARGSPPEEAGLLYYGASYGTLLGATYAALFPNRIERMILDGVADTEDYYLHGWSTFLTDFDAAIETFFSACFEAGSELCVFKQNSTSPAEIKARFQSIEAAFRKSPIGVADPASGIPPTLVQWEDLMLTLFIVPYSPAAYFTIFSQVLLELERGSATMISAFSADSLIYNPTSYDARDPRGIISCLDTAGRFKLDTFDKYEKYVQDMFALSYYGAPNLAAIVGGPCAAFDIVPPESQVFPGKAEANQTSNPILFVSSTIDPVTPLEHAKKMSSQFAGSEVLAVENVGHSSFGVNSECTDNYTIAYMANATLPPSGTICDSVYVPFPKTTVGAKRMVRRGLF